MPDVPKRTPGRYDEMHKFAKEFRTRGLSDPTRDADRAAMREAMSAYAKEDPTEREMDLQDMASAVDLHTSWNDTLLDIAEQCLGDSKRWFPEQLNLPHMGLGLTGEAGEVANIIKKIDRGSLESPFENQDVKDKLTDEMADVFTYLMNLAGFLQIDMAKEYMRKRLFNEKRFGDGRD
jgi:NTP pyrophosphatase (non-canonical NTP hydrolase)